MIQICARVNSKISRETEGKTEMTIAWRGREAPKWHDSIVHLKAFNSVLEQQSSSPFLFPFYKNGCHVSCGYESVQGFSIHIITSDTPHNVPCCRQCTAGFCHTEWLLRLGRPASHPATHNHLWESRRPWAYLAPQVWKMGILRRRYNCEFLLRLLNIAESTFV